MVRFPNEPSPWRPPRQGRRWLSALALGAAALAVGAMAARQRTRKAERAHPPLGRFVQVDGVMLHYLEQGDPGAPPLVLLHDSGATADDFDISGLLRRAAGRYRTIAFDRPGFGHSEGPADARGDAQRQADLIAAAMGRIGIERAVVLGHGWGGFVALALALNHPQAACSLVLLSCPWYPRPGLGLAWRAAPALPGVGGLLRHAVAPWVSRAAWPLTARRLFAPAPVTGPFRYRSTPWLALRPAPLHAQAAEMLTLRQTARTQRVRAAALTQPVVLVTGENDRAATRLLAALPGSRLREVEGAGHMVHHVATGQVLEAIDEAAALMRLQVSGPRPAGTPLALAGASDAARGPR